MYGRESAHWTGSLNHTTQSTTTDIFVSFQMVGWLFLGCCHARTLSACVGSVMYQTSPEEPALVVGKLAHKHRSAAVLLGHYSVQGSTVSTV